MTDEKLREIINEPNESGSTQCIVRWMIETPAGWIGSYDKEALIAFAAEVRAEETARALNMAADYFDGTLPFNWMCADGYRNAFDIAGELRYMATEALQRSAKP